MTRRYRNLQRHPHGGTVRDHQLLNTGHCFLKGEACGHCPSRPVTRRCVVAKPAIDRVATEVDHGASVPIDLADERAVDDVQVAAELFGSAPRPKSPCKGIGERSEPGDVSEQGRTCGPVR